MNALDLIRARHSVRQFRELPLSTTAVDALQKELAAIGAESGLRFILVLEEPSAFSGKLAHYGSFRNCKNYIALVGKKHMEERVGYYGERAVLFALQQGVHSCWTVLTYRRKSVPIPLERGERLYGVIALGYGVHSGRPHHSKPKEKLCHTKGSLPEWFDVAMEAVMLAPTAVNQQKFRFVLQGDTVDAKALRGPYSKIDLGIAKYHFELGAQGYPFSWTAKSATLPYIRQKYWDCLCNDPRFFWKHHGLHQTLQTWRDAERLRANWKAELPLVILQRMRTDRSDPSRCFEALIFGMHQQAQPNEEILKELPALLTSFVTLPQAEKLQILDVVAGREEDGGDGAICLLQSVPKLWTDWQSAVRALMESCQRKEEQAEEEKQKYREMGKRYHRACARFLRKN